MILPLLLLFAQDQQRVLDEFIEFLKIHNVAADPAGLAQCGLS